MVVSYPRLHSWDLLLPCFFAGASVACGGFSICEVLRLQNFNLEMGNLPLTCILYTDRVPCAFTPQNPKSHLFHYCILYMLMGLRQ